MLLRSYVPILSLLLFSCAQPDPIQLTTAKAALRLAFSCYVDIGVVPFERSGNCVAATIAQEANYLSEQCKPSILRSCEAVEQEWLKTHQMLARAMNQSLWDHGRPPLDYLQAAKIADDPLLERAYLSADAMKAMYKHCLELETRAKQTASLVSKDPTFALATSIAVPVLQEGQLCLRSERKLAAEA